MDNLILQVGAGGIFALLVIKEVLAFALKVWGTQKPTVVHLAPNQEVILARQCSERLLKTMENTTFMLTRQSHMNEALQMLMADRTAAMQRGEAILEGLQEITRTQHAMGLKLAEIDARSRA